MEHPPEAYRPPLRMKSRILFFAAAALLVIVPAILFMLLVRVEEPLSIFPASVDLDCAPWDGSAFTVSIPLDKETITISIYQPPDIQRFVRFSFPDKTMSKGHALLLLPVDVPETLTGHVSFQRVEQGVPVQGRFDLSTEAGQHLEGAFLAEWGNEIVYCG